MVGERRNFTQNDQIIRFDPQSILDRLAEGETRSLNLLCSSSGVGGDSLLRQLSLHLPRLAFDENKKPQCVIHEAERLAYRLASLQRDYLHLLPQVKDQILPLDSYACRVVAEALARPILERFHYLLSFRSGSVHLGLKTKDNETWPVAMTSLSPFDLFNMEDGLPLGAAGNSTIVVSRVFAFNNAPRNSISFLMSKVREWLREWRPHVKLLVTYLNPNVGFKGSSYKADNWFLLGQERGTRYLYVDRDYTTDRSLWEQFGTTDLEQLKGHLGQRLSVSRFPLLPLNIYARSISAIGVSQPVRTFEHWSPRP